MRTTPRTRYAALFAVIAFALTVTACGSAEESVGTESPVDIARELRQQLTETTVDVGLPVVEQNFGVVHCAAAKFDPPAEDRYVANGRFHYVIGDEARSDTTKANAPVEALSFDWEDKGWDAALEFDSDTALAWASATDPDTGIKYTAQADWTEFSVWASSRCYSYPEGKTAKDYPGDLLPN